MKKILSLSILLTLLLQFYPSFTCTANSNSKLFEIMEDEVRTNSNCQNVIITNDSLQNNTTELKELLENNVTIFLSGDNIDVNTILASLGYNSQVKVKEFSGYRETLNTTKYSAVKNDSDEYYKLRLKQFSKSDDFEVRNNPYLVSISLIDKDNNIVHVNTYNIQQNKDFISDDSLLRNIVETDNCYIKENFSNENIVKSSSELSKQLLSSNASFELIKNSSGTKTMVKLNYSQKLSKATSESDPDYNYYYLETFEETRSGDYIDNNGYEVDMYLKKSKIKNCTDGKVTGFGPYATSRKKTFSMSVNLTNGDVSLSFTTGGLVDVFTEGGYGEEQAAWGVSASAPSFWIKSPFNFDTITEFKVDATDSSFSIYNLTACDIEKTLGVIGTAEYGYEFDITQ